eukprot:jgi/Psemu1/1715/gm1.1715_g
MKVGTDLKSDIPDHDNLQVGSTQSNANETTNLVGKPRPTTVFFSFVAETLHIASLPVYHESAYNNLHLSCASFYSLWYDYKDVTTGDISSPIESPIRYTRVNLVREAPTSKTFSTPSDSNYTINRPSHLLQFCAKLAINRTSPGNHVMQSGQEKIL